MTTCQTTETPSSLRYPIGWEPPRPISNCRNPRPLFTRERVAAASFSGIGVYPFGSGIYIRTVVRKYFMRVKYHTFIILNKWENPKFPLHIFS
ncbi:hypothetical protein HanRHA438_Chr12g0563491 [Helianthus annuus]|uniref:Uncharacterized protein n=1 Tax=Helianthus annuus TaxID=4232 RepID=A0A9K3HI96_HELAN|nr:hypothetical protein HanXRQr2_Chr12g0552131 [Helianthus annuus]KAJ0867464.1 hypothetical protein HanRHA438_Chr12g0563491 [Helianthus annuus]